MHRQENLAALYRGGDEHRRRYRATPGLNHDPLTDMEIEELRICRMHFDNQPGGCQFPQHSRLPRPCFGMPLSDSSAPREQ